MDIVVSLTLLLSPVVLVWLWWNREFTGPYTFNGSRLTGLSLLMVYLILIVTQGPLDVASLQRFSFHSAERIVDFFLVPGLAFAIILFPAVFTTLFRHGNSFSEPWVSEWFAVAGWGLLLVEGMRAMALHAT